MTDSQAPQGRTPRQHGPHAFLFVVVTMFIDMMGYAVIVPVLPQLLSGLLHRPIEEVVPWGGYLSGTYAVMNLLMQPVLGGLSDRFGRRPVLLFSMGMLALDFLIMGLAGSVGVLFLGRLLSGISGATHSTASAYIADVTEPERRGQAFGALGAAFGLGFILGPALGGLLGGLDVRAPFFAAAGLAALNFLYGLFVLPESLARENRRPFDWNRANPIGTLRHFAASPKLAWFMLAFGLYNFAHWVFPSTWSYASQIRYGWTATEVGASLAVVGVGSAIVQGGGVGWALRRFRAEDAAAWGFSISVLALLSYAFATRPWMVFVTIPVGSLAGVLGPAMHQIMTSKVPKDAQGELQGALGSVQALGNILAPLLFTTCLHHFTRTGAPIHFPGAAFLLAAALRALSVIPLSIGVRRARAGAPATD
jgi:DHA1 family tetracycline resistance protein-like MFS transporter